jgi:hypothetical protein
MDREQGPNKNLSGFKLEQPWKQLPGEVKYRLAEEPYQYEKRRVLEGFTGSLPDYCASKLMTDFETFR